MALSQTGSKHKLCLDSSPFIIAIKNQINYSAKMRKR